MHATLLVSYSHAWVFGTMPFFVCRWHNFMIIIRCMMWLFGAYQLNQRRHWTILPINFRTARCSFRIGPIMIVDEPFTVSIHSYLYSRSYLACKFNIIFCSDWQWTDDDTHHENKTGQSDSKRKYQTDMESCCSSEIWGIRACQCRQQLQYEVGRI